MPDLYDVLKDLRQAVGLIPEEEREQAVILRAIAREQREQTDILKQILSSMQPSPGVAIAVKIGTPIPQ